MSADAIFQFASMTKPVTSVAVMMLKDQGLLDLDDVVGRYLPEFKGTEVIAEFDGADGYLPKDCEPDQLIARASGIVAGIRSRASERERS